MTGQTIDKGALWCMQTSHRLPIIFPLNYTHENPCHYCRSAVTFRQRDNTST
nr:hypothetical protein [Rodentibacter myodis]